MGFLVLAQAAHVRMEPGVEKFHSKNWVAGDRATINDEISVKLILKHDQFRVNLLEEVRVCMEREREESVCVCLCIEKANLRAVVSNGMQTPLIASPVAEAHGGL